MADALPAASSTKVDPQSTLRCALREGSRQSAASPSRTLADSVLSMDCGGRRSRLLQALDQLRSAAQATPKLGRAIVMQGVQRTERPHRITGEPLTQAAPSGKVCRSRPPAVNPPSRRCQIVGRGQVSHLSVGMRHNAEDDVGARRTPRRPRHDSLRGLPANNPGLFDILLRSDVTSAGRRSSCRWTTRVTPATGRWRASE